MSKYVSKKVSEIDSELRQLYREHSIYEENAIIAERYKQCAECEFLNEIGVNNKNPICGKCDCNLDAKMLLEDTNCPVGKW